jgi:hypothetical protein
MDSLQDILSGKSFTPPDELAAVKNYIARRYKSSCKVQVEHNTVIVTAPNSALASTLHLESQLLMEKCNLGDKRLVIRTGR